MILEKQPLPLAEVRTYVDKLEDKQSIQKYLKTFTLLSKEKAIDLMKELKSFDKVKLSEENIVKIIDFLPRDVSDLNKILVDTNLSEDEANSILEIVKKY